MNSYPVIGIDVSAYQASADGLRRFDWNLAAKKIYFAFLRASTGAAGVDDQLSYNLQECRRLGIPCGLYHSLKPEKDLTKQVNLFASLALDAKTDAPAGTLPPVVDVVKPETDIGDLHLGACLRVLEDCGAWRRVEGYAWKRGVEKQ